MDFQLSSSSVSSSPRSNVGSSVGGVIGYQSPAPTTPAEDLDEMDILMFSDSDDGGVGNDAGIINQDLKKRMNEFKNAFDSIAEGYYYYLVNLLANIYN